jgi:CIC family chloride channel protein
LNPLARLAEQWHRVRIRFRTDERVYVIALVLGAGLLGAVVAVTVRYLGLGIQALVFWDTAEPLEVVERLSPAWRVLAPAGGGLVAGLLVSLLRRKGASSGEGVSEIMEAVSLRGSGRLRLGRTVGKSVASIVLNATGGSVGREGPIVQIAAAASSRLASLLKAPVERRRILTGCGVAAGMAAAYNAPIGAAMFVMEVVHGNFALEVFGPVVVASVTSTMISWGALGSAPLYPVPAEHAPPLVSLPLFALLGALVAWTGLLLRSGIEGVSRLAAKVPFPLPVKTALGGLAVGVVSVWIPQVWGNGYDGVAQVLSGGVLPALLFPLLLAKIFSTSASLGSGGSGGVFTPALLVGAAGGALFGLAAETLFPALGVSPVFWALGGMSAAIASTTFAPITALLMVFEMSQNYGSVMPLATVVVTSTWVARQLRRDSIYTESLRRRGVDFDLAFEEMALASLRAEDLIRTDPMTVPVDAPLREVLDRFGTTRQTAVYALDGERLVGSIDLRDAFQVASEPELHKERTARTLVRDVPRLTPRTSLEDVMRRFSRLELAQLPVVSSQDPDRLLGTVARRDVVAALDREVVRRRMLLARFLEEGAADEAAAGRRAGDLSIREIDVPEDWNGMTLGDADPYGRFGVFVLAVRRLEGEIRREVAPVGPDWTLTSGDRLVLLGKTVDLDRVAGPTKGTSVGPGAP